MNIPYLMRYLSTQLQTNVIQYSVAGDILHAEISGPQEGAAALARPEWTAEHKTAHPESTPIMIENGSRQVYVIMNVSNSCFQIGPVRMREQVPFQYVILDWGVIENTEHVVFCDFDLFVQHILLMRNVLSNDPIDRKELLEFNLDTCAEQDVKKHFSDILFENQESGKMHNPYDQEVREISSIRNGDLDQLERSLSEKSSGHYGVLAQDPLRSLKNICIVVITLASRAAIEGGVSPEIAYSLSDSYIYQMEELNDRHTIHRLCRNAEYEYTRLVYDIKQMRHKQPTPSHANPKITRCKDYIFGHLHEKITIAEIARELNVNANYLADLFTRTEGMTIRDFIMQEKVNLARNLLIYSEYTYSEIATSLGFCSQSHFGKIFKEVAGITPKQYRDTYGMKLSRDRME